MNKFSEQLKDIVVSSSDTADMCSEIIKYFTQDESFADMLSDETTQEYEIFNLSIKYLDSEYKDRRGEISEELKMLLAAQNKN